MPTFTATPRAAGPHPAVTREEEIFAAALALSGEARREFLDRECGDDSVLRENIEALLEAHDSAGDFLRRSPADELFATVEPQPGDRIGPYTIVSKLGEGGCGLVFLAEQEQPIRRRVALKVIKPGMDSKQVIARFEAERQALALMEHPDIARVFDAGATTDGHPYFVMEYVDGAPITRFCDETQLPLAGRLELFERICLALQHAHQKGVVHRDVKPSNILVALHDGRPAPKIIDFGIAKATQARLTDSTILTGFEQFIGTPAYMSPEQAERRDLDIDTRSDIYSLGVLLYELLTGQPPFDPKSLVRAGVDEIRRIIREVDPPRPSAALSTLAGAERTTVARRRAAAPERLASVLRGDLDWIVMRCLEKDRARRYGTANELAEDIRRHLHSEPVTARPPSTGYRLRKFARRHRVACATVAAVALSLVLGTIVSVAQAVRANRAEQDARRRQEQAEGLLTFMLGDFRTELQKIGRLKLLDRVGDKAMAYFAGLSPRDLTDTALNRQAEALTQIGQIRMDETRYNDAQTAFATAYARAAVLAARHPGNGDMLFERAQAEFWIGDVALERNDIPTARLWLTRYRDSAIQLSAIEHKSARSQIEVASGQHNLAVLEFNAGALAAAEKDFVAEAVTLKEMLRNKPDDLDLLSELADIDSWLGSAAEREGRYADAIGRYREMSVRYRALAARAPAEARWRLHLAQSLMFTGGAQIELGRSDDAQASYAQAGTLLDALVAQDPENKAWLASALDVRLVQAAFLLARGDTAAAAPALREVRDRFAALAQAEPTSQTLRHFLTVAWCLEARLRLIRRQSDAGPAAARALELGESLVKRAPADPQAVGDFAHCLVLAGRAALAQGSREAARRHWERAVAVLSPLLPGTDDARLLDPAAQALTLDGRMAEARPLIERLHRARYHSIDPLAKPLLDFAFPSENSTQNNKDMP